MSISIARIGALIAILMLAGGCVSASFTAPSETALATPYAIPETVAPKWRRTVVDYETDEAPGTIIVDTSEHYLYLVMREGKAVRYGVGLGKAGFAWKGEATIRRKTEWPVWTPPEEMIERRPSLRKYADGMDGGPDNPLGARALYLYQGDVDTLYRLHGTDSPYSIGRSVSSGCVRMLNDDVADLYERVPIGTKVIVL